MAITFHPRPGTVLICDFSTGFRPPEMVKRRPLVVVSPRRRHHSGLCLVVPFSTVSPKPVEAFHYVIPAGAYAFLHSQKDVWAKGDMLSCVAFHRLDRVLLNGRYVAPSLRPGDFAAIQLTILAALEIRVER
jgi:mRNA interferase MazF